MPTSIQNHNCALVDLITRLERVLVELDSHNLQTAAIHVDMAICELCEITEIERQK